MKEVVISVQVPDDQNVMEVKSLLQDALDENEGMRLWSLEGIVMHEATQMFGPVGSTKLTKREILDTLIQSSPWAGIYPWEIYAYQQLLETRHQMLDRETVVLAPEDTITLREYIEESIDTINDEDDLDILRGEARELYESMLSLAEEIMPEELDREISEKDQHAVGEPKDGQ